MGGGAKLRTSLAMAVLLLAAPAAPANGAIRLSLDGLSFAPEDVNITDNATVELYVIAETWGDVSYYIYMTTGTGTDYNDMDWATSNIYGSIAQPVASANAGELAQVLDANGWYLQAESIPAQPPEIMDGIHFVTSVTAIGNAGESFTVGITDPNYEYIIGDCLTFNIIADTTQPSPDPMVWATPPYATGAMSIRMVATTASDPAGVEYYFECTAGGGHDSGWQDGTLYEDTGLIPNAQYTYRVKARDKSGNHNETNWSVEGSAATSLEGVIYVDDDASPGGTGLSWETAYKYLQDALVDANSMAKPVEIWVAEGTYKPDQGEDANVTPDEQTETFRLINDVAIYGGFPSTGARENRNPNAYETILSGDLNGDDEPNFVNNDENSYHVTTASDINETAVLDGFTITAGNAWGDVGGGMYNEHSRATVRNCKFNGNEASGGGGMFNYYYSSTTLTNCVFTGNSAGSGGGMYNDGSNPELVNCTFNGNTGGGMYNGSSSPTMTNCTFNGNTASYGGGMLNEQSSSPVMNGCTFTSNTATNNGGGMLNEQDSSPTLDNCTFTGNEASVGGGMCNYYSSNPTLTNCTFTGGSAGTGGGMYNNESNPELVKCTFSGNTGGGGMYNDDSSLTVTDCTFSGNSTGGNGGGMYNFNGSSTVTNCTFEENRAYQFGGGMYNSKSSPTVTDCIFRGNDAGVNGGGMHNESESSPTLTRCTFSRNTTGGNGGGMYNYVDSSPTVKNCTFSGNWAESHGGGMYNYGNRPTLTDGCTFSGNLANWGGGMYNYSGSPTLTGGCTFSGNVAISGGGMYNRFGSPTLDGCTFNWNWTGVNGGGMYNDDSSPTLTYCTFSENRAHNGGGMVNDDQSSPTMTYCTFSGNSAMYAGGMYNCDSNPVLTKCTFSDNLAGNDGGGIYNDLSDSTLTNCTFRVNSAFCGAGMYSYDSSPMVTNCVFSGNAAASVGGAMHNNGYNSRPILTNCTFSGNSAGADGGGGIYNDSSDPNIANCILWGNIDSGGYGESAQIYNLDSTPVVNYCCVEGWTGALGGTGNIGDDPLFKDADGEDDIVGTQDDDLHLTAYSSCIDAGDNNSVPVDTVDLDGDGNTGERTPLDLAGNARFTDDPVTVDTGNHAPGYPKVVEMGAYERYEFCGSEVYPYPPGDVSGPDGVQDCYIDFYDFAVWAAHWLEYTGPE